MNPRNLIIILILSAFRFLIPSVDLLLLAWTLLLPANKNDYPSYEKLILLTGSAYSLIFGAPVALLLFCISLGIIAVRLLRSSAPLQTLRATVTWVFALVLIVLADYGLGRFFMTGILAVTKPELTRISLSLTLGLIAHYFIFVRRRKV